ncbi:hypothetical protein [Paenibacillus brevis]|uniref:DUF3341 domain-containing protein n=1 Tax=Paenibacillus brevis TaxID=2841508 RepID=A0ABS6FTD2_9BACL|nr:hypothetical protein [Paenibacillus brevis]MBU5672405.1 hypothetical protein [Paenibacillus brevis]
MGEKNILAYFKSPEEAGEAAAKLRALRAADVSIDRISRYGEGYAVEFGDSLGILSAADPASSGMSHGGQGGPTGRDILLTAVVDEGIHHQALRLIEDLDGLL